MMAKCTKCEKTFDSHDGGYACQECKAVYCPECEFISDGADEPICPLCDGLNYLERLAADREIRKMYGLADMKPEHTQSKRALRLYYCALLCGLSMAMVICTLLPAFIVKVKAWCPAPFWLIMTVGAFFIAMGNFLLILKNDKG